MSHITKVKTQLKDAQVLRRSLEKIGYDVQEGGLISGASSDGKNRSVELLAQKAGCRIGFRRSRSNDNAYEALADWHVQRRGQRVIINEIVQTYSREKILDMARHRGYSVIRNQVNQRGQIELILRKVA